MLQNYVNNLFALLGFICVTEKRKEIDENVMKMIEDKKMEEDIRAAVALIKPIVDIRTTCE